jgi:hypothetical protein
MTFAFSNFQTDQALIELQEYPLATPLFATLAANVQMPENKTTLSSVFATLTRRVKHKFFVCRSYKKHPGWGYTYCALSLVASPAIPFGMRTYAKRACKRLKICTSKTQDLKPFRIRTYEKNPRGVPLSLSLPHFPPSAIIIGLAFLPGPTTVRPVRTFRSHDAF